MRFGLGVPTGTEGMMYPVPYADIDQAVGLAVTAERLGFDSVWGNDHMSTQAYVREEFAEPPNFFDPWLYLANVAARTTTLGLATCITVLPFRHPAVLAKQAATLDHLSHGRVIMGVGIGAYREEFESLWPGRALHRGQAAEEALQALALLFRERRASFAGRWVSFADVESYPKPVQQPLPVLSGGNSPGSKQRAATLATGWLPACLTPDELAAGIGQIRRTAGEAGRQLPDDFDVALQLGVAIGRTREQAVQRFRNSQLYAHLTSLSRSTLKDQGGDLESRNLVGTPEQVLEQVERYREAGATTLAGLLFAANTVKETEDDMALFSQGVIARVGAPV
ncbi:LLM class flavin-dependent oxidoreductase [Pseudonocardia sp.]|uniref:LLM class flavin-dependent oxidoreductase n=1 Tax=Pseudonocardia sp. TaxID=60912 RepID=UPI0031FE1888